LVIGSYAVPSLFNLGWISVRTILYDSLLKNLTIAKSSDAQTENINGANKWGYETYPI
jgi:hypothetical protein